MDKIKTILSSEFIPKSEARHALETFMQYLVDQHQQDPTQLVFRQKFPMLYTEYERRQEDASNGISWYSWPQPDEGPIQPIPKKDKGQKRRLRQVVPPEPRHRHLYVYCPWIQKHAHVVATEDHVPVVVPCSWCKRPVKNVTDPSLPTYCVKVAKCRERCIEQGIDWPVSS